MGQIAECAGCAGLFCAILTDRLIFSKGKVEEYKALECTTDHIDSELYDVIINDNIDQLKKMEGRLSLHNQHTPTKNTVLHLACQHGSINCVNHILSVHGLLVLELNSRGETALHLAARGGYHDVAVALISTAKSLPNLKVTDEQVQELIRKANLEGETALHAAVRYNHKDVVELLVTQDPSHEYPRNKYHETPLYLASIRCNTDVIKLILDNCESISYFGPEGRTPLHAAVLDDNCKGYECVKLLLGKSKDLINQRDYKGWTVFHYVAYNDHYTIVEDLAGAAEEHVPYLRDWRKERTALHVAAYKGNIRVMEELLKYFPDSLDIVDGRDRNILHIAVEQDKKEVIRFILSRGCKATNNLLIQRDNEGNTPLHLIAKLGCFVKELMDLKELDWEVLNNEHFTPLDVLHSGHEAGTRADQEMISTILVNANVRKPWLLWQAHEEPDIETANNADTRKVEEYRKMISTHMIVAALIATVALTAGFTMPGGFDGNQGPSQGSPILLKKTAFKFFIVADSIALFLSISSLSLYFMTTMQENVHIARRWFFASVRLNFGSIIAMMVAFISGTYSVLDHSSKQLAISFCVVSSFALLLMYYVFSEMLDFFVRGPNYLYMD